MFLGIVGVYHPIYAAQEQNGGRARRATGGESRKALDRALAEQDAMDAMVRRSIERHGP